MKTEWARTATQVVLLIGAANGLGMLVGCGCVAMGAMTLDGWGIIDVNMPFVMKYYMSSLSGAVMFLVCIFILSAIRKANMGEESDEGI